MTPEAVSVLDRASTDDRPVIHTFNRGEWKLCAAVFSVDPSTTKMCNRLARMLEPAGPPPPRASSHGRHGDTGLPLDLPACPVVVDVDTLPVTTLTTFPACTPHDAVSVALRRPSSGVLCLGGGQGDDTGCTFSAEDARDVMAALTPPAGPRDTNSALWWAPYTDLPAAGARVTVAEAVLRLTTLGEVLAKAAFLGTGAVVAVCEMDNGDVVQCAAVIIQAPSSGIDDGRPMSYVMLPRSVSRVLARDVMLTVDDVRLRQVFEAAADADQLHQCLSPGDVAGGGLPFSALAFVRACRNTSSAAVAMTAHHTPSRMPLLAMLDGWENPAAVVVMAHHLKTVVPRSTA